MFLWPLMRFWTYSPLGWLLAVIWNMGELMGCQMPFAGGAFGIICGYQGKKVN